jgi:integrase
MWTTRLFPDKILFVNGRRNLFARMEVLVLNADCLQEQDRIIVAGHLEEKRGIFQMAISWKEPNGKRVRKSFSTGLSIKGNKKRAEVMMRAKCDETEKLLEAEMNALRKGTSGMGDILFADYMEHKWLPLIKTEVKVITFCGYWRNVTRVIGPHFRNKGIKLKDLTANDVNDFYSELRLRVKATSIHQYHANMHKALRCAAEMGWVGHSIMNKVRRPKAARFVGKFLKQSEVVSLFEAVKGHKLELGVILGAFYGLRRSEIVGLKWSAIDFEANTITIEHTVASAYMEGRKVTVEEDTTKSKSSLRTLPLVPQFRAKLLELKAEQEKCRELCKFSYDKEKEEYLYVDQLGKRMELGYLTAQFPKFMVRHGFRRIRFHDLRHSCASLLLSCGVPLKNIQEWLGHSSYTITANIYAHLEVNSKVQSAMAMEWIDKTPLALSHAPGNKNALDGGAEEPQNERREDSDLAARKPVQEFEQTS